MRDEWAKLFAGEFDRHLQIKLDYYRSKPSLAMRLFRRLVGRHEYKESRQVLITHRERLVVSQRESSEPIPITPSKTTVIHEEFHATPQLIQKISLQAADFVFRRLELERIRKGYI
ncbi:MAG: hypothetical protein LBR74_01565 [Eubacterium sp.]|nr:hypothetical protein [Eubacterium sp.]